ncbi:MULTISPECIES: hypothetical protein [unclassified Tolypothrix]|uniref:hypothetical protein n=1 Tax=unclassified Tolypothrix TaxID=2649714 RepID=UPI0005EAA9AD|nr:MULTISPECIES: hypothetical protein [unclassified Tolypothrix]BAY95350.1 hypothetical protein NIES3275_74070 [Microchaete diplosiphon NIES-3275]EKE96461.1 hypothetical protein FDUTEX481_07187 [Tolypothrix sp. PCC 7601]MBE9087048.1 hypothetical protein [Tolypothrix sp. LEGE 11397]UYD30568.1 hypothetical protein HGR01_36915 [Tolypothrix sp. PCC 7712]UYD38300.1 hypothetical protein HG267_37990 [Tolypothrix sp. PCC 7601]
MADKQNLTPEKVRIKDSYRERIFAESQQLDKSYLETLYFIIDCYFAFKKGAFPIQQAVSHTPVVNPITINQNQLEEQTINPSVLKEQKDLDGETFTLDFDL